MAKFNVSYGAGESSLFLVYGKNGFELLDYEFNADRIHEIGGGRKYYQSCSGMSGAGYLTHYGELIPVGYYRVDTYYNDQQHQHPVEIAEGIKMMVPYASHRRVSLYNYPVVIVEENTVIYCRFGNMEEVLQILLNGEEFEEQPRFLKRNFVNIWRGREEVVEIKFYDFFEKWTFNPWEFVTELLADYAVDYPEERLHRILHVAVSEDGTCVETCQIGEGLYAKRCLKGDPALTIEDNIVQLDLPSKGWQFATDINEEPTIIYKFYKDKVYIVGWVFAETAYMRAAKRLSQFMKEDLGLDRRDFTKYIEDNCPDIRYLEFELEVPKVLFFLDKEKQFAIVRKGIAKKVRKDLIAIAKQFIKNFNDQQMLESIPDDMVVKFEDSLSAGNCRTGTQSFVDKYFPGKMETTAGELKKYSGNVNVMRIFRYIVSRDVISG